MYDKGHPPTHTHTHTALGANEQNQITALERTSAYSEPMGALINSTSQILTLYSVVVKSKHQNTSKCTPQSKITPKVKQPSPHINKMIARPMAQHNHTTTPTATQWKPHLKKNNPNYVLHQCTFSACFALECQ